MASYEKYLEHLEHKKRTVKTLLAPLENEIQKLNAEAELRNKNAEKNSSQEMSSIKRKLATERELVKKLLERKELAEKLLMQSKLAAETEAKRRKLLLKKQNEEQKNENQKKFLLELEEENQKKGEKNKSFAVLVCVVWFVATCILAIMMYNDILGNGATIFFGLAWFVITLVLPGFIKKRSE